MPQGARTDRVGEEFREILAEEIQKLKDPRIGFVTVIAVKVSPDLRRAQAYYTAFGDDRSKRASAAALKSATPHLRHELGRQVRLKVTPELDFREDDTYERGARIDTLIERIHAQEEAEPDG